MTDPRPPGSDRRGATCRDPGFVRDRRAPLFVYVQTRLHRRLFFWFGATIFATIVAASVILWMIGTGRPWHERLAGLERFASERFAEVWDRPDARERLAAAIHRDLEIGVILYDAAGRPISAHGEPCTHPHAIVVRDDRGVLGKVVACAEAYEPPRGSWLIALAGAGVLVWLIAGTISVRLTRPFMRLMRVVRDIGDGKLDRRIRLEHFGNSELSVLADAVNDMVARIERQLVDQRRLLAEVSHEIRTPLGHVRVLLEILRGQAGLDHARLDQLEAEVIAIDALVGQLLARSRLEFLHGPSGPDWSTLSPRPLDAVELAIGALERAHVDPTRLEVDPGDTRFVGDAALVLQALANLLRNAGEHGGGVIALRVRTDADRVVFEVEDHGPGFAPHELERAFESFRRGRSRGGSLGLGLALVRRIAAAHEGRAWAKNREGGGACVGFSVARKPESHR